VKIVGENIFMASKYMFVCMMEDLMQIYFTRKEKRKETYLQRDIHFKFTIYIFLYIQILYR